MNAKYNPSEIEPKWQKFWEDNKTFKAEDFSTKPKKYILDMFPYPSGMGLHVGHPEGYTATDIFSRYWRLKGFNVLHPMGWDAFGLPAENYAIKTGTHPSVTTQSNVNTFRKQIKSLGFSYDWEREVDTTDPEYYKWTQWIFLQLFKKGLAYEAFVPINFCPSCKTGLANEEVVNGKCERCGTVVERKNLRQWMLRITAYADRLLSGLEQMNWPESIKTLQRNWIGRSEGAEVTFKVAQDGDELADIVVYTTRPDTLFGATYMVLSPEHELVQKLKDKITNFAEVTRYATEAKNKSDLERTELNKDKTGVELEGIKAINPVNDTEIPIWISDYVLSTYGTGAIMAVPAHDERDYAFAKKFDLPIIEVISGGDITNEAFTDIDSGKMVNSDFLNGLLPKDAIKKMITWLEANNLGKMAVNYKLRDWVFSRQRYWGEPMPLIHCDYCKKQKQKALLIHGFEGNGSNNWFPYLKQELEKNGYEVFAPDMPNSEHPVLADWLKALEPYMQKMGANDVVIGHSLGSKAALHLIEQANKKIGHVYLIASAIGERNERDWQWLKEQWPNSDVESLKKIWETDFSWEKVSNLVEDKNIILSDDDPWISRKTHENIPAGWMFKVWHGFGHFNNPVTPELLELVLRSKNTGIVPVPESELPLTLPMVEKYEPSGTGESPLVNIKEWVEVKCPVCGGKAQRETNTMPQWAGSSWYWLRYIDSKNPNEFASAEKLKYWLPVDVYLGGAEHAVLHLLYARFWNMVLFDLGYVPQEEPFVKLVNQGLILGEDGEKMSKSRGNVVNPDDILREYGADVFRLYEMFMGPLEDAKPWSTKGMVGLKRFLEKVWAVYTSGEIKIVEQVDEETEILFNQTVMKVGSDVETMGFNTAISTMMILVNRIQEVKAFTKDMSEQFLVMLSPFAPHLSEELWQNLGYKASINQEKWPVYDVNKVSKKTAQFAIQVNGKVRAKLELPVEISEAEAVVAAKKDERIKQYLAGAEIKKIIFVPGRLISFVI